MVPPVVSLVTSHAGKEAVGLGVSGKQGHADVGQNDEKGCTDTKLQTTHIPFMFH